MSTITEHSPAIPEDFDMTPATAEEIAEHDAADAAMNAAADGCMDSIQQLSMGLDFAEDKNKLIKYLKSVHTRFHSEGFEITAGLCAEMLLAHTRYSEILKEFEDSEKQIVQTMAHAVTEFKSLLTDVKSLRDNFVKFFLQRGIIDKLRELRESGTAPVEATLIEDASDVPTAHASPVVAAPTMTPEDINGLLNNAIGHLVDAAAERM